MESRSEATGTPVVGKQPYRRFLIVPHVFIGDGQQAQKLLPLPGGHPAKQLVAGALPALDHPSGRLPPGGGNGQHLAPAVLRTVAGLQQALFRQASHQPLGGLVGDAQIIFQIGDRPPLPLQAEAQAVRLPEVRPMAAMCRFRFLRMVWDSISTSRPT